MNSATTIPFVGQRITLSPAQAVESLYPAPALSEEYMAGDSEVAAMSTVIRRREFVKVVTLGVVGLSTRTELIASSAPDERCHMKLSGKTNLTVSIKY
jgi:hypothetical protein